MVVKGCKIANRKNVMLDLLSPAPTAYEDRAALNLGGVEGGSDFSEQRLRVNARDTGDVRYYR